MCLLWHPSLLRSWSGFWAHMAREGNAHIPALSQTAHLIAEMSPVDIRWPYNSPWLLHPPCSPCPFALPWPSPFLCLSPSQHLLLGVRPQVPYPKSPPSTYCVFLGGSEPGPVTGLWKDDGDGLQSHFETLKGPAISKIKVKERCKFNETGCPKIRNLNPCPETCTKSFHLGASILRR